jgi:hypothetical protein
MNPTVKPIYRHRQDGKARREVELEFKGAKIYGKAKIEVSDNGFVTLHGRSGKLTWHSNASTSPSFIITEWNIHEKPACHLFTFPARSTVNEQ